MIPLDVGTSPLAEALKTFSRCLKALFPLLAVCKPPKIPRASLISVGCARHGRRGLCIDFDRLGFVGLVEDLRPGSGRQRRQERHAAEQNENVNRRRQAKPAQAGSHQSLESVTHRPRMREHSERSVPRGAPGDGLSTRPLYVTLHGAKGECNRFFRDHGRPRSCLLGWLRQGIPIQRFARVILSADDFQFWRALCRPACRSPVVVCSCGLHLDGGTEFAPVVADQERSAPDRTETAPARLSAEELAAWIDNAFDASWKKQGVEPAPRTNDGEFVRRVFLDLIGRIPSVAETRAFFDDARADKRHRLVEELLQRGAFAAHLANTWRDLLLAGSAALESRAQAPALEIWLKLRFSANMPYDQLVGELLTATLDRNSPRTPSPLAFYQAAEFKPEQLAANASRLFLGVQVQCAQCHDHPFAEWKQPQFWSFAAFFNNLDAPRVAEGGAPTLAAEVDEIRIPRARTLLVPALVSRRE